MYPAEGPSMLPHRALRFQPCPQRQGCLTGLSETRKKGHAPADHLCVLRWQPVVGCGRRTAAALISPALGAGFARVQSGWEPLQYKLLDSAQPVCHQILLRPKRVVTLYFYHCPLSAD